MSNTILDDTEKKFTDYDVTVFILRTVAYMQTEGAIATLENFDIDVENEEVKKVIEFEEIDLNI